MIQDIFAKIERDPTLGTIISRTLVCTTNITRFYTESCQTADGNGALRTYLIPYASFDNHHYRLRDAFLYKMLRRVGEEFLVLSVEDGVDIRVYLNDDDTVNMNYFTINIGRSVKYFLWIVDTLYLNNCNELSVDNEGISILKSTISQILLNRSPSWGVRRSIISKSLIYTYNSLYRIFNEWDTPEWRTAKKKTLFIMATILSYYGPFVEPVNVERGGVRVTEDFVVRFPGDLFGILVGHGDYTILPALRNIRLENLPREEYVEVLDPLRLFFNNIKQNGPFIYHPVNILEFFDREEFVPGDIHEYARHPFFDQVVIQRATSPLARNISLIEDTDPRIRLPPTPIVQGGRTLLITEAIDDERGHDPRGRQYDPRGRRSPRNSGYSHATTPVSISPDRLLPLRSSPSSPRHSPSILDRSPSARRFSRGAILPPPPSPSSELRHRSLSRMRDDRSISFAQLRNPSQPLDGDLPSDSPPPLTPQRERVVSGSPPPLLRPELYQPSLPSRRRASTRRYPNGIDIPPSSLTEDEINAWRNILSLRQGERMAPPQTDMSDDDFVPFFSDGLDLLGNPPANPPALTGQAGREAEINRLRALQEAAFPNGVPPPEENINIPGFEDCPICQNPIIAQDGNIFKWDCFLGNTCMKSHAIHTECFGGLPIPKTCPLDRTRPNFIHIAGSTNDIDDIGSLFDRRLERHRRN
jgi:hypothetical protein